MSPRRLNLPDSASFAQTQPDGRLFAPSADRNAEAICTLVGDHLPVKGRALELASGTGQHITKLAQSFSGIHWTPSDIDPARLESIAAYAADVDLPNLARPLQLDATAPGWAETTDRQDFVLLVNLLHLISDDEAETVITEAAKALAPGGKLMIYGPFMRGGELTSPGDEAFHAKLTAQDPDIGYKDDFDTLDLMEAAGLQTAEVVEMPANNLALIAAK